MKMTICHSIYISFKYPTLTTLNEITRGDSSPSNKQVSDSSPSNRQVEHKTGKQPDHDKDIIISRRTVHSNLVQWDT